MIESIEYTKEDGDISNKDITVYALSTCGFCKRGLRFLRENSIKFKFVYVDKLDYDVKQEVKADLKRKYDKRVAFPFLVVDNKEAYVGFVKDDWEKLLLE